MHYNGGNSYLFVNVTEIYKFKAKDPEILVGPISLGKISKNWSVDNIKRTGFTGYVMILVQIMMALQLMILRYS